MSFHVQACMCVLLYKYKESTHFDFCLVKCVQRITVLRYMSVTPLLKPTSIIQRESLRKLFDLIINTNQDMINTKRLRKGVISFFLWFELLFFLIIRYTLKMIQLSTNRKKKKKKTHCRSWKIILKTIIFNPNLTRQIIL